MVYIHCDIVELTPQQDYEKFVPIYNVEGKG